MELNNSQQTLIHSWNKLPHITEKTVSMLIKQINNKQLTPRMVFEVLRMLGKYLKCEQLRTIQSECSKLYSDYNTWYLYDHALCSRVTDRWNLTPKYGAEGYYYCSSKYAELISEPPHKWDAMQLEESFF